MSYIGLLDKIMLDLIRYIHENGEGRPRSPEWLPGGVYRLYLHDCSSNQIKACIDFCETNNLSYTIGKSKDKKEKFETSFVNIKGDEYKPLSREESAEAILKYSPKKPKNENHKKKL